MEIAEHSDLVVFAAQKIKQGFEKFANIKNEVSIRPQGLYKVNRYRSAADQSQARRDLRLMLNLKYDAHIIIAVGFGDERKGIDLFADIAQKVISKISNTYFIWIGNIDINFFSSNKNKQHVRCVGHKDDTDLFYAGADIFALTSREDPFPSVVMEAMDVGLPVVGFEGAGGFESLLHKGAGLLAPSENTCIFSEKICKLLENQNFARELGKL
ncbi:MAG: glycosyltransferase family 4 protein, partial [Nitrosopumilaceae archaeon]|nr:glycosyltransferase family 4 protein [Nitrosopumilaceae archaeon]